MDDLRATIRGVVARRATEFSQREGGWWVDAFVDVGGGGIAEVDVDGLTDALVDALSCLKRSLDAADELARVVDEYVQACPDRDIVQEYLDRYRGDE